MAHYCESFTEYKRLPTREVKVGNLTIGGNNPIRIQTMTTTDTKNTDETVAQTIRCIEAGAELVRITAPSKRDAENLREIKDRVRAQGYDTPLVADIHFTPNAAEIAARIVEKVRVNPGNYADKKKFLEKAYTDESYKVEIDRIRKKFTPLVKICKKHGTAMRIGTNHGSLSDRIMSRFGDTPKGMVESAMEFLRIARAEDFHQIILSMKASNPLIMVNAYRLLVKTMQEEFGECYPLHLGVTEAGDGEDGRIKSAMGLGTLLEDGIGDTIRISLTEDPEFEIPVCRDVVERYKKRASHKQPETNYEPAYDPLTYQRRATDVIQNIGGEKHPVVIADFSESKLTKENLKAIGYRYMEPQNNWMLNDCLADYVYTSGKYLPFNPPEELKVICDAQVYKNAPDKKNYFPLFTAETWLEKLDPASAKMNFISIDCKKLSEEQWSQLLTEENDTRIFCLFASGKDSMHAVREKINELWLKNLKIPVILCVESLDATIDKQLIHFASEAGALLLEGMGNGIWLKNHEDLLQNPKISGRTYLEMNDNNQFLNNTAFSILQASRTRITKTEYISCPACGRTLFDLQEVTEKIRERTYHLKGVKIGIMGCIVNGPGEMADADFGYVGSGPGKITLYKGKEVVKRNIPEATAVDELIVLLKENNVWIDPPHS
ncbi:MAG TPA: (E)-4-hydroxy-3-methylbut-2-enyl-diphosphate synthase [Chitinophagaceae bacterium]|nr:(E)-4-hydroxy-3-methylbut-2-enyl-diphosphate synthase [Chitinophagaceae bacterium]